MFGNNKIEKQNLELGSVKPLEIQEIFTTLQGEGPNSGTPAVFIRLRGCNLQCDFCDTDFESGEENLTFDEVVHRARRHADGNGIRMAVITGGEPFRQNIIPLIRELAKRRFELIEVETAGTLWIPGFDSLCIELQHAFGVYVNVVCSPKTPEINKDLVKWIGAFKYIIPYQKELISPVDGLPLHPVSRKPLRRPVNKMFHEVFVQPVDPHDIIKSETATKNAIASALQYGYRLSLQTHKILNLP